MRYTASRKRRQSLLLQTALDDPGDHHVAHLGVVLEHVGSNPQKRDVHDDQQQKGRRQCTDQLVTNPRQQPVGALLLGHSASSQDIVVTNCRSATVGPSSLSRRQRPFGGAPQTGQVAPTRTIHRPPAQSHPSPSGSALVTHAAAAPTQAQPAQAQGLRCSPAPAPPRPAPSQKTTHSPPQSPG